MATPPSSAATTTRAPFSSDDAGRLAAVERGPQRRHRHASRHLVGVLDRGQDPRGRDGCALVILRSSAGAHVIPRSFDPDGRRGIRSPGGSLGTRRARVPRDDSPGGHGNRRQIRPEVVDELDDVLQGREVAELQVLLALDPVGLAHCREDLGLLHRVDPEVRLEVEVHLQHVLGVAGLLGDDLQDLLDDRVRLVILRSSAWPGDEGSADAGGSLGTRRARVPRDDTNGGHGHRLQIRPELVDELHHVGERREIAELQVLLPLDPVGISHRGEDLGLLDGVDPEVRLEVEVHLQHVLGVAGLLGDDLQDRLHDVIRGASADGRRGCGVDLGSPWRVSEGPPESLPAGFPLRGKDGGRSGDPAGATAPAGAIVVHELHHVRERREVAELQVLLALDPVGLPHRRRTPRPASRCRPRGPPRGRGPSPACPVGNRSSPPRWRGHVSTTPF